MKTILVVKMAGGVIQNIECEQGGDVQVVVKEYFDEKIDLNEVSESFQLSQGIKLREDESGDVYEESSWEFN